MSVWSLFVIVIVLYEKKWRDVFPAINKKTKALIKDVLQDQGYLKYTIEVIYANDNLLHQLNNEHRGINKPTNILSFPHASDFSRGIDFLGEMFLSRERIEYESQKKNITFHDHCIHILVHGLLHLIGYTHYKRKDTAIMEFAEIEILAKMNIKNPYE